MQYVKKLSCILTVFLLAFTLFFSTFADHTNAATSYRIEINKSNNTLYLYSGSKLVKTYRVATGRSKKLTPEGTFPIVVKFVKPGWTNPDTGKQVPGGSKDNPLGERWLGLKVNGDNGRRYGIHGTNKPSSIGTYASSGCVRMYNKEVIDLFNRVPIGTKVWIHSGTVIKPGSGKVKVTLKSGTLNVRSSPSTSASIITRVKNGTILNKIGTTSSWVKVKLSNGKIGYVSKAYVRDL
ncbi:SH3 domain-containing protein [Seinonella peptonophila]|uniref:SH3 domain-containing protein n=1 Tax=Seinonella peptonophila TaxID=112248 RepID=A0A1M4VR14_9BACL|nr:L,D-transpeptidase family protein [Seinonella peptonophila]SHE71315.1 SH3 domain-containing protein [Seinonella peptonophila]